MTLFWQINKHKISHRKTKTKNEKMNQRRSVTQSKRYEVTIENIFQTWVKNIHYLNIFCFNWLTFQAIQLFILRCGNWLVLQSLTLRLKTLWMSMHCNLKTFEKNIAEPKLFDSFTTILPQMSLFLSPMACSSANFTTAVVYGKKDVTKDSATLPHNSIKLLYV